MNQYLGYKIESQGILMTLIEKLDINYIFCPNGKKCFIYQKNYFSVYEMIMTIFLISKRITFHQFYSYHKKIYHYFPFLPFGTKIYLVRMGNKLESYLHIMDYLCAKFHTFVQSDSILPFFGL